MFVGLVHADLGGDRKLFISSLHSAVVSLELKEHRSQSGEVGGSPFSVEWPKVLKVFIGRALALVDAGEANGDIVSISSGAGNIKSIVDLESLLVRLELSQ